MNKIGSFLHVLLSVATGIVGYTIHQSLCYAIVNGVFYPIAWAKWLICKEVNLSILREAFGFLLN